MIVCAHARYPPDGSVEGPHRLAAPLGVARGDRPGGLHPHGGGGYGHGGARLTEGSRLGSAREPLLFHDNELRVGHVVRVGSPRFSGLWRRRPCWDRASVSTGLRDCGRLGSLQFAPSDARTSVADVPPPASGCDSGGGRLRVGIHTRRAALLLFRRFTPRSPIDGSGGADRRCDPSGERRQRLLQLGAHLRKPGCSRNGSRWIRLGDDAQPMVHAPYFGGGRLAASSTLCAAAPERCAPHRALPTDVPARDSHRDSVLSRVRSLRRDWDSDGDARDYTHGEPSGRDQLGECDLHDGAGHYAGDDGARRAGRWCRRPPSGRGVRPGRGW